MNGNGNGWLKLIVTVLLGLILSSFAYTSKSVDRLEDNVYKRLERIEQKLDNLQPSRR